MITGIGQFQKDTQCTFSFLNGNYIKMLERRRLTIWKEEGYLQVRVLYE